MSNPAIWIALVACAVTCYFSTSYLSLRTFSRKRLGELLEDQDRADWFDPFVARISKLQLMTGTLRSVVNMVVLLAVLYHFQSEYEHWERWVAYLVALGVAGALVSVFSVAIPTSWARYRPEQLLARSMLLLNGCVHVFMPIINLLHLADPVVRRISGATEEAHDDEHLSEELISVVEEHADGKVDEDQRDMIEAVVEFRSTEAGEIMTPRTDVIGIEVKADLEQVKKVILEEGHSRIPVYDQTIDNVVGILYARDLISLLGTNHEFDLRGVLREVLMVPETKSLRDLLAEFKSRKVHIAIVLDEYGGMAGLVTIEDVVEEIVGDIEDEYEETEARPSIHRIDDQTTEVDARVYIDDVNDELDLELPEDEDFDTVGGFVFSTLGHVPKAGEAFEFENLRVTVTDAQRTKVLKVRFEVLEKSSKNNGK